MRILVILVLSGALGVLGCDSDEGSGGSGGSGGTAGSGGSAGSGGAGGASAQAIAFCDRYEASCTYGGDNYDDRADCLASFDGYDAARQQCVTDHLGLAEGSAPGDTRVLHCGHAAGLPPCGP